MAIAAGVNLDHFLAELHAVFHHEPFAEWRNVFDTAPEGGQQQCQDIETKVEILTKTSRRHLLLEISVRSDNDTEIPSHVFGSSHATERSILQNP